ncbi:MAG TPA: shikimate dehydrogenase [Pyrinomonadaceae bacterium]|jgi:3-dehydroquinate dehydratase/shikimate dehydrogenase|nr:shikimate dehydrogenase [Pyrinomonadaceae bacterium]
MGAHRLAPSLMSEADSHARLCVPVCEKRASHLRPSLTRAAQLADIIELRLDCLDDKELHRALRDLPALVSGSPRPLILTLRPAAEGGQSEPEMLTRLDFWTNHFPVEETSHAIFADLELDLAELFHHNEDEEKAKTPDWDRVICSHHDFAGVPADLEQIYERMMSTPARVLKLAVQANEITDCISIFRLLERARQSGREMIAIAMGTAGIMTRILGPARGAFLTYGSFDAEHSTAPGQIGAQALRHLYHLDQLDEQTTITGLMGLPVLHSVSPHMHNAAFQSRGLNAVYLPFEVRDVEGFLRRMVHPRTREMEWNLRGLSVTAPHKLEVMKHLDWLDQSAREIGAVNTIVVEKGLLHGYNTDAAALLAPLEQKIGPIREMRVAVIGAGGAARGALRELRRAGAHVTLFARNIWRAETLAAEFKAHCEQLEGARFAGFEIVINATPLGTRGASENQTPAVARQLEGARLAYDLVYNPVETLFMREAREAGCAILGGLPMLVAQAAAQFKLWTSQDAPTELMSKAAGEGLERQGSGDRG